MVLSIHNDKATYVATTDNGVCKTPTIGYKTKRAAFALNKKKLTKNLKKDAQIAMFDTTVNNYDENISIKCSSGFFLEVASPGFHDLAMQSSGHTNALTVNDIKIHCSDSKASLDESDLLLNRSYSFILCERTNTVILATVKVHVHITTKLVQLQGSKLVHGLKAPVWFYENVLKNTLNTESMKRKALIENTNERILSLSPNLSTCKTCNKRIVKSDKSYNCSSCPSIHHKKCTSDKSNRTRNQPINWRCNACVSIDHTSSSSSQVSLSRKRSISTVIISDEETDDLSPPLKTFALDTSPPPAPHIPPSTLPSLITDIQAQINSQPSLNNDALVFVPTDVSHSLTSANTSPLPSFSWLGPPMPSFFIPSTPTPSSTLSAAPFRVSVSSTVASATTSTATSVFAFVPSSLVSVSTNSVSSPVSSASSSSSTVSSAFAAMSSASANVPLAESANKQNKTSKNQVKTKAKPTLATNPSDFEKESLKIERDACRLKILENDDTIKDLKEQVKILSTRCSLFEKKRNDEAYNNLVNEPTRSAFTKPDKTSSTAEEAPQMNPNCSPASPIDSLINLEVLKAAKNLSSNSLTPASPDVSAQFQILELKFTAQVEALKSELKSLLAPLLPRSPDPPKQHPLEVLKISSLNSSISASTQTDSEQSFPTPKPQPVTPPMTFSIPPPPIKSTCDMSIQTTSPLTPPAGTNCSTTGTQTKSLGSNKCTQATSSSTTSSLLGTPPIAAKPRVKGHFAPLSEFFLHAFGPITSEKLKNKSKAKAKTKPEISDSLKSKYKQATKSYKSKRKETSKPQQKSSFDKAVDEKDALLIDLSDPIPTPEPESSAQENVVPESTVLEPSVAEPPVTETSVPETSMPETSVPETSVPDTSVQEPYAPTAASKVTADADLIDFNSPDPDVALNELDSPEVTDSFGDPLTATNDKSSLSQTLIDLNC